MERSIDHTGTGFEVPASRRSLPRDAMWFASGTIAGKAVALISLPIFARLLTPAQFGRLDVLNALVSAGLAVLMLGTDLAATRLYFDSPSLAGRRRLLSSWLVLVTAIAIPSGLILIGFAAPISEALFGVADLAVSVALVGVVLIVGLLDAVALGILRTTGRARAYGFLEGTALVGNAILAILLLVVWRQDAAAVMLALAVSWGIAAAVGLVAVRASFRAAPGRADARRLLHLGLPLAPAVGAVFLGDFVNRSLLLGVAGAEQAGYLSIGIRIASIAGLIVAAIQLAWPPHAYRLGSSRAALEQLGGESRQILVAVAAAVVLICALVPEVTAVLGGGSYEAAGPAASVGLAASLFAGIYLIASLPSAIAKATSDLAWSAMSGVAAAVAANLILAPRLGAVGTAAAMTIGQAVAVAVVSARGRRHLRFRFWGRGTAAITIAALAVCLVSAGAWELPIGIRIALAIGFLVVAWAEGTLAQVVRRAVTTARA